MRAFWKQAEAKGYPEAPKGFEWVAKSDGSPYLRRQSGRAADLPQVKFDPNTHQFKPVLDAPDGYHWNYENGTFTIRPNGNSGDLPPMQYDPVTQGFMTADGKPYNGDITTLPVRGQDFDGFTKSVRDPKFDPDTAKQAYELYAKKDWAALEKLFNEKGLNGGWPPNRGFIDMKPGTLKAGDSFDRFGGKIDPVTGQFVDTGRFVAPFGADFGGRALPQATLDGDPVTGDKPEFKGYKILKDIPVTEGDAIPWFGQPGGGKQYELHPGGIDKLIADGYIVEITAPNLHGKTEGGDGTTNDTNKTDGGDVTTNDTNNTDGGGMRGPEVYPTAPVGERVMDMTPAEVNTSIISAVGRKGSLPKELTQFRHELFLIHKYLHYEKNAQRAALMFSRAYSHQLTSPGSPGFSLPGRCPRYQRQPDRESKCFAAIFCSARKQHRNCVVPGKTYHHQYLVRIM